MLLIFEFYDKIIYLRLVCGVRLFLVVVVSESRGSVGVGGARILLLVFYILVLLKFYNKELVLFEYFLIRFIWGF